MEHGRFLFGQLTASKLSARTWVLPKCCHEESHCSLQVGNSNCDCAPRCIFINQHVPAAPRPSYEPLSPPCPLSPSINPSSRFTQSTKQLPFPRHSYTLHIWQSKQLKTKPLQRFALFSLSGAAGWEVVVGQSPAEGSRVFAGCRTTNFQHPVMLDPVQCWFRAKRRGMHQFRISYCLSLSPPAL